MIRKWIKELIKEAMQEKEIKVIISIGDDYRGKFKVSSSNPFKVEQLDPFMFSCQSEKNTQAATDTDKNAST